MPQTFNVGARSRFVTTIAWAVLALGLLALFGALAQGATGLQPGPRALIAVPPSWLGGWLTRRLLDQLPWVAGAGLLAVLAAQAAAVGLLLRLEWARRAFIALLIAAIAVNLGGLWLQQELMLGLADLGPQQPTLAPRVAGVFGGFVAAARTLALLLTLSACALLGWIAWRLTLPPIRQEFG